MASCFLFGAASLAATASIVYAKTNAFWKQGFEMPQGETSSGLAYKDGPLLSNVHVVPLYWGTQVQYNYDAFYTEVVSNSTFMATLHQYERNGTVLTTGTAASGLINVAGANNGTVNATTVQAYIQSLVDNGTLDPSETNLYVPVHFGPVTVDADDGTGLGSSCVQWCAYHHAFQSTKGWIYYGMLPDVSIGYCAGSCGSSGSNFGNNCLVASHELAEAITDPDFPQTGWTGIYGEIGDYCNGNESAFCGRDGLLYYVQQLWSNSANGCVDPPAGVPSTCPNGFATGSHPTNTTLTVSSATSTSHPTSATSAATYLRK